MACHDIAAGREDAVSDHTSLGDRMKAYEHAWRVVLPRRVPVIIRVDGKAFHTLTRHCDKPFDDELMASMDRVAVELCEEIQGACLAFVQSDEVSVLIIGHRTIDTQPWLANGLQKQCSISASIATREFNRGVVSAQDAALFDARVFLMPEDEVCNYFIWRQQDATRNSIQMVARAHFSHRECDNKNTSELQALLHSRKGINWNDLPVAQKRGRCVTRVTFEREGAIRHEWRVDHEPPIFTADREYVERHLRTEDEMGSEAAE